MARREIKSQERGLKNADFSSARKIPKHQLQTNTTPSFITYKKIKKRRKIILQSSTLKAKTMWRVNAIGYQW
jgi:hypothetical protein